MVEDISNIDFNSVANDCGLYSKSDSSFVISKIEELKNIYSRSSDLVRIYNYLLMASNDAEVSMFLIRCIDEYRDSSSLEVLVDILLLKNNLSDDEQIREKFVNVRVMCAKAIANLKDTTAVSSLLYCLNNKNEHYRVRLACADALGRIGDKYAVAPLIDVVKDEDEKSVYVRESAALALGLLGDRRAVDPLVSILESKNGIMDKFSFLKERIIEALNKMGFIDDDRVYRALKNSLEDDNSQVRIDSIEALMNSDCPDAFEIIKKVLVDDKDEEVKKNALIALYNMSDRGILDEVINSSEYSDTLKMEAVNIIDEYETEEQGDE